MIHLSSDDFVPLDSFPLRWRWTDERWARLPAEVLERIRPVNPLRVADLTDFGEQGWREVARLDASGPGSEVAEGLRAALGGRSSPAVVLWDRRTSVVTDSEVFAAYWDDFCYPSSDDVSVIALAQDWKLEYRHWEEFIIFGPTPPETQQG